MTPIELKRRYRNRLRSETFEHYGRECAICGESDLGVLTIDHIFGGGDKERATLGLKGAGWNFYVSLRLRKFPEGYQTLCANCNLKKALNE